MAAVSPKLLQIPGLEVVGRGVYLRPNQPPALKPVLFAHDKNRTYYSKETKETYTVPEGYDVNDSPPMPAMRALNHVVIEESWERFDKQTSLDASLATSNAPFSIDVNIAQVGQLRREEDAYYALRESCIPLWELYVLTTATFSEKVFTLDVPEPFSHSHRRKYDRFFERYGTHVISRAWVGGKAMLAFTIVKSSQMTKEDIQAGINASFGGFGSGSLSAKQQEDKEKLQSNSECTVFGTGGDELKLATLSSLDKDKYNEWLATITTNPEVIEFEAVGIWTLIGDERKAKALMEAYTEATVFEPVKAILNLGDMLHVFKDTRCVSYDMKSDVVSDNGFIKDKWPALSQFGFERVDAAFRGDYLRSPSGEELSEKAFFFSRDKYLRYDIGTDKVDPGYPRSIADGWPGVTFERVDAVVNVAPDAVYFFKGNEYIRFNTLNNRADDGYPDVVSKRWVGVTFDRIDAAIYGGNTKVYFFRGNQYVRYDTVTYRSDAGYPKSIIGNYFDDLHYE